MVEHSMKQCIITYLHYFLLRGLGSMLFIIICYQLFCSFSFIFLWNTLELNDGTLADVPPLNMTQAIGRVELPLKNVQESANYTCTAVQSTSSGHTISFTTEIRVRSFPKVRNICSKYNCPSLQLSHICIHFEGFFITVR